ncbi:MAG: hypothetical protein RL748_4139 [Pseudomonadota bacterium]
MATAPYQDAPDDALIATDTSECHGVFAPGKAHLSAGITLVGHADAPELTTGLTAGLL